MGCRFEFILDPRESSHDPYCVEAIADELVELVLDWHDRLTVFSGASMVSRVNAHPVGLPIKLDQDLFELFRLCEAMRSETMGAFNIASGTLMHAHGFRAQSLQSSLDDLDLEHAFILDADTLSITRCDPRVSFDFGGIAKGFVLDLIADELRGYGIHHAFVHGGTSSSIALGCQGNGSPWAVRVNVSPQVDARLCSMGLGISALCGREIETEIGGVKGHIMDPCSHLPVQSGVSRVACTHPSAAIADAYSTALNVRPEIMDTLHEHGCSIALFDSNPTQSPPIIRDRLGVYSTYTN